VLYECFLPELLKYCYVRASSRREAEEKARRCFGSTLVICKETKTVPRGAEVIENDEGMH